MTSTRILLGLLCVIAAGCAPQSGDAELVRQRFYAMGTWVDVSFLPAAGTAPSAALAEIEALLRRLERDYYPWADGELAALNTALAEGRSMRVSAPLAELLERARELSLASDGLFEPGLGPLVELWGFHTTLSESREPPDAQSIAAALESSGGIAGLEIDGIDVRSSAPGLRIDLGGIAKGAAIARVLALLDAHGIDSALVNAGGDLAVTGRPPGGRPWRVGIRDPRGDGLLATIELADGEAAFTSGDYERFYEHDGRRQHHLLDPSTGRPATHTQAITVIGTDPVVADAAATALFIAGPERWLALARQLGVDAVLRVDASGTLQLSGAMRARLEAADAGHDIIAATDAEPDQ